VQLVTDTQHGLVVTRGSHHRCIDYRQLDPALERCEQKLGRAPRQIVADGDYTNHASVQAAATHGVDFLRFVARELEAHRAATRRVAAPLS